MVEFLVKFQYSMAEKAQVSPHQIALISKKRRIVMLERTAVATNLKMASKQLKRTKKNASVSLQIHIIIQHSSAYVK